MANQPAQGIDNAENVASGRDKALEAWAAMQQAHKERRLASQGEGNSSSSSQPTNNENKILDTQQNGFNPNATGIANSTGVSNAQGGGNSFGQGGKGSDSNGYGGQPSGFATLSPIAKSSAGPVPEVMKGFLSFPDMDSSPANSMELKQRVKAAENIAQHLNRNNQGSEVNAAAGEELGKVMAQMETSDLQAGAKIMANARLQKNEPNAENVSSYRGDGFQKD